MAVPGSGARPHGWGPAGGLCRGSPCTHLPRVLEGEHCGHGVVLQVLAVSKGAEALGAEVLRADDRVLLGLEVAPTDVQHPLLQQLGAAEREPKRQRRRSEEAAVPRQPGKPSNLAATPNPVSGSSGQAAYGILRKPETTNVAKEPFLKLRMRVSLHWPPWGRAMCAACSGCWGAGVGAPPPWSRRSGRGRQTRLMWTV